VHPGRLRRSRAARTRPLAVDGATGLQGACLRPISAWCCFRTLSLSADFETMCKAFYPAHVPKVMNCLEKWRFF
jgi:hypothetical protein